LIEESIDTLPRRQLVVVLASACSAKPGSHRWITIGLAVKIDPLLKSDVLPRCQSPENSLQLKPGFWGEHRASSSLPMTIKRHGLVAIPSGLSPV